MINRNFEPRNDIIVIGVGNTLREDDGVGIRLVNRLKDFFSSRLKCIEILAPDIILSQEIAQYDNLLIIDAMTMKTDASFMLIPVEPDENYIPSGYTSHIFNWGAILAMTKEVYNHAPDTEFLGICSSNFGISEELSPACAANAEKALDFLREYCSQ